MDSKALRIIWLIWLVLALCTTSTLTFLHISLYAPEFPLVLQEGNQHSWRVWRPFPTDHSQFEMGYHRGVNGDLRFNLLGDKSRGLVGESVLLNVRVNGNTCTMQQDDVTGWNDWVFRPLFPLQSACVLSEHSGWNDWQVEVIQVSPKLQGESTRLLTDSLGSDGKSFANNRYGKMSKILFWEELLWVPFFLFMSIPLFIDGLNRLWAMFGNRIQAQWRRNVRQAKPKRRRR